MVCKGGDIQREAPHMTNEESGPHLFMATWSCHLEMIKGDCLIRKCKIGPVTRDPNKWTGGSLRRCWRDGFFLHRAEVRKAPIGGNQRQHLSVCRHCSRSQISYFKIWVLHDQRLKASRDSWVTGDEIDLKKINLQSLSLRYYDLSLNNPHLVSKACD